MPLAAGERVGPYEIIAPLGEGGMGVVYRARDTRLGREVALKMLPSVFERDPSRRQRFEQEARALAALNHPNILAVFDVGENYLITELIEGASLAGAQLTLRKALDVAAQIAEGLAAAHAAGIAHRDLKPENVMVTKDGRVKILDFGLAKQDASILPEDGRTVKAATDPGTVMGTVGYMSPEQVRGRPVSARTDIFSLGVILHELIGGERPFRGDSAAETMAAIVKSDAPPLPTGTPGGVMRLIDRCLAKEPGERWQSAQDLAAQLRWLAEGGVSTSGVSVVTGAKPRGFWQPIAVGVLTLALVAASAVAFVHFRETPPEMPVQRFEIANPDKATVGPFGLSVSPDGRWIVFSALGETGVRMLWSRRVDAQAAVLIPGTERAFGPMWSSDSRFLAFTLVDQLKKVPIAGGPPQAIAKGTFGASGGSWNPDDTILITKDRGRVIGRVSGSLGTTTNVLEPSAGFVSGPQLLPGGKHFLYSLERGQEAKQGIYVGSPDGKLQKQLIPANRPAGRYVPSSREYGRGYLLFLSNEGALMAQAFQPEPLQLTGEAVQLVENVRQFSASENGLLVYQLGSRMTRMAWLDRTGKQIEWISEVGLWDSPRLSPDGKRVAVRKTEQENLDIWIIDLARKASSRFTFDKGSDTYPLWSPDGAIIVYGSSQDGRGLDLYQKNTAGAEAEAALLKGPSAKFASSFSPDGKLLLYEQTESQSNADTFALPLTGDRKPYPVLKTEFGEFYSRISPDGKWLAYCSDESGSVQVYVQPFPPSGAKWQISTRGGVQPEWRGDGRELFYRQGSRIMAVDIRAGATIEAGVPKELFEARQMTTSRLVYQASADGTRFLVNLAADERLNSPLQVVVNWEGMMKRK